MSAVALWRTPEEVAKVFAMDEKIAIEALPAMQAK
jgi:hypothetical protein